MALEEIVSHFQENWSIYACATAAASSLSLIVYGLHKLNESTGLAQEAMYSLDAISDRVSPKDKYHRKNVIKAMNNPLSLFLIGGKKSIKVILRAYKERVKNLKS